MASILRVWAVTTETWREVIFHNRWFQLSLIGIVVLVFGIQSVTQLPLGSSSAKLIFDLGLGAVLMSLGVMLIISLVSLLNEDKWSGTLHVYLVRRLRRWEYLLGKLMGCWLSLVVAAGIAFAVLGLLVNQEIAELTAQGLGVDAPGMGGWILLYALMLQQWLVLGTVVVFLTVLSRSFLLPVVLSSLLCLVSLFAGSVSDKSVADAGISQNIFNALQAVLPRFDFGDVANGLWYHGFPGLADSLVMLGFGFAYGVLLFAAAAFVFGRKEL